MKLIDKNEKINNFTVSYRFGWFNESRLSSRRAANPEKPTSSQNVLTPNFPFIQNADAKTGFWSKTEDVQTICRMVKNEKNINDCSR